MLDGRGLRQQLGLRQFLRRLDMHVRPWPLQERRQLYMQLRHGLPARLRDVQLRLPA